MSTPIQSLFDKFVPKRKRKLVAANRAYFCRCGRPVFFCNSVCLACNTPLGFAPHLRQAFPLTPGPEPDTWQLACDGVTAGKYRRYANLITPVACNWLLDERDLDGNPRLACIACRIRTPNAASPSIFCVRPPEDRTC